MSMLRTDHEPANPSLGDALRAALSRHQQEAGDMRRPHRAEVPMVEGRDPGLAQAFRERDDRGVDHTQGEVAIRLLELACPGEVRGGRGLGQVHPGKQVIEEGQPCMRRQPFRAPVVELGKDQQGDHQVLGRLRQERSTTDMVRIGGVQRRQQWAGIEDEGHSARWHRDWLAREIPSRQAIGGSCDADPGPAPGTQGLGLLLDRLPEHGREGDVTPACLRLERPQALVRRGDRGPSGLHHDA